MSSSEAEPPSSTRRQVWLVNHYADAPDHPAGTRHFDLAQQLVRRGRAVTIFAAGFSNMTHRDERLGGARLWRTQWIDGVRFVWIRTFAYSGNSWRRQVNMLSFLLAFLLVQTRIQRPDVVVGSTVHPFAALGAWMAARARRAAFVFEIRDLWPQTLVDLGAMRVGSPGERLLRVLESFLVRRASRVVTLLPGIVDYLKSRGLPTGHVVYVPNGVDITAFDAATISTAERPEPVTEALATIERMRASGRIVAGYVGAFGRVNRADIVARAGILAEEQQPGRIGLVLIGDGPERPDVEAAASREDVVKVLWPVPKRFVPAILDALDVTVVHTTETPVYRYGISFNKLFEYMAASRPVVFACSSAYDPVAAVGAGVTVSPDDPQALADGYLEMVRIGQEGRAAMGAAGRTYALREHNIEHLGGTLDSALTDAIEGRAA